LLAGLAARVEGARHLSATERTVVEQSAVFTRERHTLRDTLVDDVHTELREPVDVCFAGPEVAALHRVVEEALDAVTVVAVVLRRVDPALRGDAVRAPRRVMEREQRDVVSELAERRGGRRAGQPAADHDDLVAALVRGVHQFHLELVLLPLALDGAVGDLGVERSDHGATLMDSLLR
jgi:hypothetical protein